MAKEIETIGTSVQDRFSQVSEARRCGPGGHGLEFLTIDVIGHI
jgi:hypothetical protein